MHINVLRLLGNWLVFSFVNGTAKNRTVRQQTAVFFADTHTHTQIYRRTQTLNPPCAHAHRVKSQFRIYPLPEIHGHPGIISVNYLRVRLRRIEWQALRS